MRTPLFFALALTFTAACATLQEPGSPEAPADSRYCGEPKRDADGDIHRDRAVLRRFAAVWACPSTGLHSTSCPGWNIDHVIPLAVGGCDLGHNLQWMPVEIKRCADDTCKDRWERRVYDPDRAR